jgi:transposase-like protein
MRCAARYGERSTERTNTRNGYRRREWDTRADSMDLVMPKLRTGSYFPDWLLERRRRAGAALVTVVATSYPLGVSTRRMEKLVETLGITRCPSRRSARWPKISTPRWRRSGPGRWTPGPTRSWPRTYWS